MKANPPAIPGLKTLPSSPGVYLMRDSKAGVLYIGKALNLRRCVASYFSQRSKKDPRLTIMTLKVRHIDYIPCASEREALILEQKLIRRNRPDFNTMWRDDKSYPYVALTWREDFPRIYLTRHRKKDGTLYFGPYPNASDVKHLLRWAWREKLFPLRPCRFEFDSQHLPPFSKVRSCLYLHTGECTAPCVGKISSLRYRRIAQKARWFFEGEHRTLVHSLQKDMKRASRRLQFEEAAKLRDRIRAMSRMREPVTIKEVTEETLAGRLNISRGLSALTQALNLPRAPTKIEAFDISHIQGSETVGSMACFQGGLPDKSSYRRFIIRSITGVDDFSAMREVVGRRYKRLALEGGRWPDLILIDGGKGQLAAALEALESITAKHPPMAALAKENEEIFLPGRPQPVRLPKDSPALHLVQRVRDEAHRFAVSFHKLRRKKRMLKETPHAHS